MYEPYAVTVLTTEERCDFFRAAVGEKADFHFDPYDAMPLHLFLSNIALSAGRAVVLDEDYFLSADSMVRGLHDFLDDAAHSTRELRFVLVCSRRKAGDALLRHVVSYFGIYDVVYDCTVRDAAHEAARVLASPNRRVDVLELFRGSAPGEMDGRARAASQTMAAPEAAPSVAALTSSSATAAQAAAADARDGRERGAAVASIERDGFRVDITLNITPIV